MEYFWAIGATKTGRNEPDKALMRLCEEFRHFRVKFCIVSLVSLERPQEYAPKVCSAAACIYAAMCA